MNPGSAAPFEDERLGRIAQLERRLAEMITADLSQRRAFEMMSAAILIIDRDGMIIDGNLAAARMIGIDAQFLSGKPLIVHLDPPCHQEFWHHRQRTTVARGACSISELALRRRDQSVVPVRAESVLFQDAPDRQRIVMTLLDLQDRRRAEAALAAARTAAEELVRARTAFLDNMSHEMRTPLNGVIGFVDLLRQELSDPEQVEMAELALQSARGLTDLIGGILDLSRLESGRLELDEMNFRPRELVEEALSTVIAQAAAKDLQLSLTVPVEVPLVLSGDRMRVRQIIINLLGNAVKFTERGFIALELARAYDLRSNHQLVIHVRDSGPGIPPDRLGRIFDRFEQGDPSLTRAHGGSGLGLTIVRQLAQLMRGTVSVDSELGYGSCFTVRLQLPELAAGPEPRPQQAGCWYVLEDRELTRRHLANGLSELGVTVEFLPVPAPADHVLPRPLLARAELLPDPWRSVPGVHAYSSRPLAGQMLAPILPSRLMRLVDEERQRRIANSP